MRNYFLTIILILAFSNAGQKDNGLELENNGNTAIIPYHQNILIFSIDGRVHEGSLLNISSDKIYIKDIATDETITIPKQQIEKIKANAITPIGKNFFMGAKTGISLGVGFGLIVTYQQYLEHKEILTIYIGAMFFTPIVSTIGGLSFGFINVMNKNSFIKNIDVFKINKDHWKIVAYNEPKEGMLNWFFKPFIKLK